MGHCVTCQRWMWSHCHPPPGWGPGASNKVEVISWDRKGHGDEDLSGHQCSSLAPQPSQGPAAEEVGLAWSRDTPRTPRTEDIPGKQ